MASNDIRYSELYSSIIDPETGKRHHISTLKGTYIIQNYAVALSVTDPGLLPSRVIFADEIANATSQRVQQWASVASNLKTHMEEVNQHEFHSSVLSALTDRVNGTASLPVANCWQKITKPNAYQTYDIETLKLFMSNTGSAINIVLDIYSQNSVTDSSSPDASVRFSGQQPIHTTPAVSVSTSDSIHQEFTFDFNFDDTNHSELYIVLREENNGSLSGLNIQGTLGIEDGGTSGVYVGFNMKLHAHEIYDPNNNASHYDNNQHPQYSPNNSGVILLTNRLDGSTTTTISNMWQTISKPSPHQTSNVDSICLLIRNMDQDIELVLDIYGGVSDSSSLDPSVRFANQAVLYTTPAVTVIGQSVNIFAEYTFNINFNNTSLSEFYIVLREKNNGSTGLLAMQGDTSINDGASNNSSIGHNMKVYAQSEYVQTIPTQSELLNTIAQLQQSVNALQQQFNAAVSDSSSGDNGDDQQVILIDNVSGTTSISAANVWARIDKNPPYESYNIIMIDLFMHTSNNEAVSVVLDIYNVITDASSSDATVSFAGQTPIYTSSPVLVQTSDSTFVEKAFSLDHDLSSTDSHYFVIREENNGSIGSLMCQAGDYNVDHGLITPNMRVHGAPLDQSSGSEDQSGGDSGEQDSGEQDSGEQDSGGQDSSSVETIISRVGGTSTPSATNAWQTIVKPSPYENYNVTSITLFMYNTESPINVVLELYAAESDTSTADPNTRFSSNDLVHTTAALSISTPDTNFVEYEFSAQIDNTSISTFYIVLKEENGGSLASIRLRSNNSLSDGGAGNNYTGHDMIVKAEDIGGGQSGGNQNSEIEIYSVTSGGSETGHYSNSWQEITKPSPYESYNITSIKIFLTSTSGTGYLNIYDSFTQEHAAASQRFIGLTPIATSNTVDLADETIFDFPDGTNLTNNPPYYFNLVVASGASGSNIVFDYSATPTSGGSGGGHYGILNHVIYGVSQ